jgi:hypothetical protein
MGMDNVGNEPSGFADVEGTSGKPAAAEAKSTKTKITANALYFISGHALMRLLP